MSFTNDFLSYSDLITVALIGLVLVLRNAWDFANYSHEHSVEPHLAAHPLQAVAAIAARVRAATVFPHAHLTAPRLPPRRRQVPQAFRGHRPLKPAQA